MKNGLLLKKKFKEQNLMGLALDIDETLSSTAWYWFERLRLKFGNPENLSTDE